MNVVDSPIGFRKSWLVLAALLYLLLPNVIFLLGWVRPEIAYPLSALLLWAVIRVGRISGRGSVPPDGIIAFNGKKLIIILALAFISLFFTELISFHGHFAQDWDMTVRNAVYDRLINHPWPLYSDEGGYFVYYHAFWLPPALLAKYVQSFISPNTLLFIWCYIGIFFTLLLAYSRLGMRIVLFLIVLCLYESLPLLYYDSRKVIRELFACNFPSECHWVPHFNYCLHHIRNTFNHGIAGGLCLMLIFGKTMPVKYYLLPAGLLCSMSPMLAIAMIPYLFIVYAMELVRYRSIPLNIPTIICAALVFLTGVYMLTPQANASIGVTVMWAAQPPFHKMPSFDHASFRMTLAVIVFLSVLIPFYFLTVRRMRKTKIFIACCVSYALITFVCIGAWNNELLFKGSLFGAFAQALIWCYQWPYLSRCKKLVFALCMAFTGVPYWGYTAYLAARTYSWKSEKMEQNIKYIDIHHTDSPYYHNFYRPAAPSMFFLRNQTSPNSQFN